MIGWLIIGYLCELIVCSVRIAFWDRCFIYLSVCSFIASSSFCPWIMPSSIPSCSFGPDIRFIAVWFDMIVPYFIIITCVLFSLGSIDMMRSLIFCLWFLRRLFFCPNRENTHGRFRYYVLYELFKLLMDVFDRRNECFFVDVLPHFRRCLTCSTWSLT